MATAVFNLPNGAHFIKCALQVNPFGYVMTEKKETSYSEEAAYNQAMVAELTKCGVGVIAITDHQNIKSSTSLEQAATAAGIHVFRGFELESKDGIHLLCLFDPEKDVDFLDRLLGHCGILDEKARNRPCQFDAQELIEKIREYDGICIAPHICIKKGLLFALRGQARANLWRNKALLCCAIDGSIAKIDQSYDKIVRNVDTEYERERPMAFINCNDISDPKQVDEPSATTFIKMSNKSVEALRQAFLDPVSRIRLNSDAMPEQRMELVGIEWTGGFLGNSALRFNDSLNVVVGGRGSGKSTLIESIRYVLDIAPLGADAKKNAENVQRHVIQSGTKIKLYVQTYSPTAKLYTIERTVPNPPVVRDQDGVVLQVKPSDVFGGAQIYGQHEIGEVAKGTTELTDLLDRFSKRDDRLADRISAMAVDLEKNRTEILEHEKTRETLASRLAALPAVELKLSRYQEVGIEAKLQKQTSLIQQEAMLKEARNRIKPFEKTLRDLRQSLPISIDFVSDAYLKQILAPKEFSGIATLLSNASADLVKLTDDIECITTSTSAGIDAIEAKWQKDADTAREEYDNVVRSLQETKIDVEDFLALQRKVSELKPLAASRKKHDAAIKTLWTKRAALLAEWDEMQRANFVIYENAAKKLTARLNGRLRVRVKFGGERSRFIEFLETLGGRRKEVKELAGEAGFSIRAFAQALLDGKDAIKTGFPRLTDTQADRLASIPLRTKLEMQELGLRHSTLVELNVGLPGSVAEWRALDHLSTGQKATAVLLLLLVGSDAPLIIDQPEDDLDNAFISDSIVQEVRASKKRRQFLFATHNANIPVLGDAELIAGLLAEGEAGSGHATIPLETLGSIDTPAVRDLVGRILEGGRAAFDTRRVKYGY